MDNSEKPSSSQTYPSMGNEAVPTLEVPLSNLQFQEDEMLSWLQYPLEDSIDKSYCSEDLYMESPISHSSFVHDAFSNLTLREGEKLHAAGLRSHSSLPSDFNIRERGTEGHSPTAMHAWGVAVPHDTKKSDRVLAASSAMAMGAQRAAGFLFQSGAEAFSTVRTSAQPKRTHDVLPTQETGGSASSFIPYAVRVGDTRSRLQPSFQRLPGPNFSLFSRAVGNTKASLQQAAYNNSTVSERAKLVSATRGKGGESASNCEQTTGVASPASPAHPTVAATDRSPEAFGAPVITKGSSVCRAQSSATGVTGTISCKLEAEAVGLTHIEGPSRALSTPCAEKGLPSSSAASSGLASGSLVRCVGSMPKIETGRPYRIPQEGETFSCAESTAMTGMDSSMYTELARQDSETCQNLACSGMFLRVGITTSESKLCETVEMGDVTMASPSRESGDSTDKSIKEAAPFTMKRKAHPAEDSEIESKVVPCKDGKLPQGCARGAKRTRASEIHNLSERKRRNMINVKIKALQNLIPNANKTDKASILDEAIEYMKMLQSQVQLMSLMTGMPMALPPGIRSTSMQQRPRPPHLNMDLGMGLASRMGMGSGMLDPANVNRHSLLSAAPAVGHPLSVSGSAYGASGLQLVGSHAGIQEARGHLQSLGANEAYTFSPVQEQQQQHLHWNTHTNADMFGAYIMQQQQPSQLHLSARETPSDDMQ